MTPTVPELLAGNFLCLIDPPPPEAMGDFLAGKVAVVGLISLLAAQEAERGIEARVWENGAIRAVFSDAAAACGDDLGARLSAAAGETDADLSLGALDRANAKLRRLLTELHIAAEAREDRALDRRILALYQQMADQRMLNLPPMPAR